MCSNTVREIPLQNSLSSTLPIQFRPSENGNEAKPRGIDTVTGILV